MFVRQCLVFTIVKHLSYIEILRYRNIYSGIVHLFPVLLANCNWEIELGLFYLELLIYIYYRYKYKTVRGPVSSGFNFLFDVIQLWNRSLRSLYKVTFQTIIGKAQNKPAHLPVILSPWVLVSVIVSSKLMCKRRGKVVSSAHICRLIWACTVSICSEGTLSFGTVQ